MLYLAAMDASFFTKNRQQLLKHCKDGVVVLSAHASLQRNADMAFPFEQEANFWYATGIEEASWVLVATRDDAWLIAPGKSETARLFDGGLSDGEAKAISGVKNILPAEELPVLLHTLTEQFDTVYVLDKESQQGQYDFVMNPAHDLIRRKVAKHFETIQECRLILAKLRAIKQPVEIEAIRAAVAATTEAFTAVYGRLQEYRYEYEIEADFTSAFRKNKAAIHAYDPIVASGEHALTLHYGTNNTALAKDQFVLLDIGARVNNYAADITRSYIFGEPTARQIEVHAAVEKAHQDIIALLGPDVSVAEYHEKSDDIMKDALKGLGLLKKPDDYRKYFPHAVSHGLGIDVHDALGRPEVFKAGMVLTVEPGIYIPEEGIGVRIEDDILITDTGYENLSVNLSTSL